MLPADPPSADPASNRFGLKAALLVGAVAAGGWLTAFIAVPVIEGWAQGLGAFAAICRALGLPQPAQAPVDAGGAIPSQVAWTPLTLASLDQGNIAAGAKLAEDVCQACHNANGLSANPDTPSMSGQSARAIYKQLHDFKSGARTSAVMGPIVADLSPQQVLDAAAFYGRLPRRNSDIHAGTEDKTIDALATRGDAARALPACNSCHAARAGGPLETPMLVGQFPGYMAAQLRAYAAGTRANDLYGRMRTIAAKLTPEEIDGLARYYNAPP